MENFLKNPLCDAWCVVQLLDGKQISALNVFVVCVLAVASFGTKEGTKLTDSGLRNRGKPLGFKAVLVGIKGDWKFEKEFMMQSRGWSSKLICSFCEASRDEHCPFVDRPDCCSQCCDCVAVLPYVCMQRQLVGM